MEKIILSNSEGCHVILLREIIYCEAQDCYSCFHLVNGSKKMVSKTLKTFEPDLIPNGFVRIHRKYVINMEHVLHFSQHKGGHVIMTGGRPLPLSYRKKKDFSVSFRQYLRRK